MLLPLADHLAFPFPVTFVAHDILKIFVGIDVLAPDVYKRQVFNKTFTKNDFSSVVDADFLAKSVLEGIVYDKTTPQGTVYAASVCYPQTDLYVPLSITITADGKMSIQKVDMLEDAYEEETPD